MYSQQTFLSNGPPPSVHSHSLACTVSKRSSLASTLYSLAIVHARSSGGTRTCASETYVRTPGAFLEHFRFARHRYILFLNFQ